jgi:integrase
MPRAETNRIERHGKRFRVRWTADGQRFRRSFDTESAAEEFAEKLREKEGSPRVKGRLTVMDVVTNWYGDHKRNLSSGTQRDYEGRIHRDVSRIGDLQAEALARNPRELRAFYASLTPTNARRLHAILRQAFEDAVAHEELSRNPCDVVKAKRPRAAERLIPSPSEVEKMIAAAEEEDPIWGLFLNITATLGTRRAETCALRWEDIDFETHRVHIRRALCKGVAGPKEIKPPKTGRERTLSVGPSFFDEIRLQGRPNGWMFADRRAGKAGPWHPDWPGHRFQSLARRLELPYTLHSLRHFVATQLLARGLPVTQVAQFMGHKDPSVTLDLYANHIVDDVQRMMGEAAVSLFRRA